MKKISYIELNKSLERLKVEVKIYESVAELIIKNSEKPFISFDNMAICGRSNMKEFEDLIDKIWQRKDINPHWSRKTIMKELVTILSNQNEAKAVSIKDLLSNLNKNSEKVYWIYKPVIANLELGENPISVGPFTFFDFNNHKSFITRGSDYLERKWANISKYNNKRIAVCTMVKVKELRRGYELADIKFEEFENIISFLHTDTIKMPDRELNNSRLFEPESSIALSENSYGVSNEIKNRNISSIDFKNFFNELDSNTAKRIFEILEYQNRNEIQERVLMAIDWIGKGLSEIDYSKGFIQLMFAIEALLNYQTKDIIQPSILDKISESIAFILEDNYEKRIEKVKEFKRLYKLRSTIVHGKNKKINRQDFIDLLIIANGVVLAFLHEPELEQVKTVADLKGWIEKRKFSG